MLAFTKGKKQLSQAEVDTSRELSRGCLHVERAIGAVRQKYSSRGNYVTMRSWLEVCLKLG